MNEVATTESRAIAETSPDESALLAVISRAASDPNIDISKMERLLAIQEKVAARKSEAAFNSSMSLAQSEMHPIRADAENNSTRSKYASYAKMDSALRPIYTRHRLALSFNTSTDGPADWIRVSCNVTHPSGHSRLYSIDLPADGKGAKGGDIMTRTHAIGAGVSYGMRYLLKMIFNVAIGEDDNDGNGIEEVFDTTDWRAKIDDCRNKEELNRAGEELAATQGITAKAMTELRRCWAQKARSFQ